MPTPKEILDEVRRGLECGEIHTIAVVAVGDEAGEFYFSDTETAVFRAALLGLLSTAQFEAHVAQHAKMQQLRRGPRAPEDES